MGELSRCLYDRVEVAAGLCHATAGRADPRIPDPIQQAGGMLRPYRAENVFGGFSKREQGTLPLSIIERVEGASGPTPPTAGRAKPPYPEPKKKGGRNPATSPRSY